MSEEYDIKKQTDNLYASIKENNLLLHANIELTIRIAFEKGIHEGMKRVERIIENEPL